MYHLATFRHEKIAERVAGRMELQRIRTGLRDDHTVSGEEVYNLFVNDRQRDEAARILPAIFALEKADEDVLVCPECGSKDLHPANLEDLGLPIQDKVSRSEPIHLQCRSCGHDWE